MFESLGSDWYMHMVNEMKAFHRKPKPQKYHYIGDDEWEMWQAYWNRTDVQDTAYENTQNRLTEPQDGKGSSSHHYGSRAVVTDYQMAISIYLYTSVLI